jgi:hypothetical protein
MGARDRWLLGALGAVVLAVFVALAALDDLHHRVPLLLAVYALAFAAYAGAVWVIVTRGCCGRVVLATVLVVAASARLVLVPSTPVLSTDVYRYLWEGRAIDAGFNPFAHAPDDSELAHLRNADYEGVSHKHMETIYPPAAQAVFALAAALRPTVSMQKFFFVLFDLGAVLALFAWLRARGDDPARAVVYAWNPMVIFETGHSGHVDAVGVFFMVLGLWLVAGDGRLRRATAFVALALSFLAKYAAAVLVPFFARRRRYLPWLLLAAGVVVAGFLPFVGAGKKLWASLSTYSTQWRFNGLAFRAATAVWDDPVVVRWLLMAAAVVVAVVQAVRQKDAARYTFVTFGAVLLAVPTLYPWYVMWIVPLLCLFVNRAWILFTALVFVSYLVWPIYDRTGVWQLPAWALVLEYAPFLGLLVFDAFRSRRREVAT